MKQVYLILFCLFTFLSNAQITITQADMPQAGNTFITAQDTGNIAVGVSPGNVGANQTWNLANMVNESQDTTRFVAPSSTPSAYASGFPTANLAIASESPADSSYIYFESTSNALSIVGQAADYGIGMYPYNLNPPQKQITFPSTFNTSFNDSSGVLFTTYVGDTISTIPFITTLDSIRVIITVNRSSVMDGYGKVITPADTFYNALRQKVVDTTRELIDGYISLNGNPVGWQTQQDQTTIEITYSYFVKGSGYSVAEISTDTFGVLTSASYLLSPLPATGIRAISPSISVTAYPNPVSNTLQVDNFSTANLKITIYTLTGQQVAAQLLSRGKTSINVSQWAGGIYFYEVAEKNGKLIYKDKIIVIK